MVACQSCGAESAQGAKFCASCGAALATQPSTAREVRKTVTILFSDVIGSTALGERLDPEAVRRVMARHYEAARNVIERHGGTVEKFVGDAVMAVFGIPRVHEDDALRAVRAADEMRTALAEVNHEIAATGVVLRLRTGINTGEVVAGIGDQHATLVTGDAVNVAARLEQAAAPDEILLGAATVGLLRDAVEVDALEPLAVKGKTEPVLAFRFRAVRSSPGERLLRRDAPMVGRDRELAALHQAFERSEVDRTVQLFTVFGTAGVGKSRLVREFVSGLAGRAIVYRGRCLSYGDGITYWPIIEIVHEAASIDEIDPAAVARERLARLVGDTPEADVITSRVAQVIGLDPGAGVPQGELFWACRKLLESLAGDGPLVVIVDDIHWAEPTLLDLIEHVADLSRDVPILLLGTARPELLESRPTWGGGRFNATSILLEPLPPDAAGELVDLLLPGAGLPAGARDQISGSAEGNPLYVEELVAMLVDDGRIHRDEVGRWTVVGDLSTVQIPRTIQALLEARLDRLAPAERSAAERASVIGRSFERRAVMELSPAPEQPEVLDHLISLVRKDLIRPESAGLSEDVYRFRHILIRDAAYDSLPKAERASLHEQFADWLEASSGERLSEVEEIVAYHLEQAVRYRREIGLAGQAETALDARAAERMASAAGRAYARSDSRAAANLLGRTVALLAADAPERSPLLVDLAIALCDQGLYADAAPLWDEVIDRASQGGDEPMRAHAIVERWLSAADRLDITLASRDARWAIERFEAVGDELGLARAWLLQGEVDWEDGHGAEAEAAVIESIVHARRAGRPRDLSDAYGSLSAFFNTGPTPVPEAIRRCEEILEAEAGDRAVEGWIHHALAHLVARLGQFDDARDHAARSLAILDENGQVIERASLMEVVADVEVLAGNPAAAVEALEDGLAIVATTGTPSPLLETFLARAARIGGDLPRAEAAARRGLEGTSWIHHLSQACLGRIRAEAGAADEGLRLAQDAAAAMEGTDFLTFHAWVLEDLAWTLSLADRRAEAVAAMESAIDLHERKASLVSVGQARAALAEIVASDVSR